MPPSLYCEAVHNSRHETDPAKFSRAERGSQCASDVLPVVVSQSSHHVPQWITSIKRHLSSTTALHFTHIHRANTTFYFGTFCLFLFLDSTRLSYTFYCGPHCML